MRIVLGLGNPDDEYAGTRHNAGFRVADRLAADLGAGPFRSRWGAKAAMARAGREELWIVKPQLYMNRSGESLRRLEGDLGRTDPADILVVCDEVHLPLGRLRLRAEGSCGGHNGLDSVETALGSAGYARLRVGVGPRPVETPEGPRPRSVPGAALVDFVLGRFDADEETVLAEVIPVAARAVRDWVERGLQHGQSQVNGWRATGA